MGKSILFIVLGMFLMYIILKIMSSKTVESGETSAALKDLAKTGEALNLIRTNEFREVVKTPEFKRFISSLAKDQVKALSTSLVSYEPKL